MYSRTGTVIKRYLNICLALLLLAATIATFGFQPSTANAADNGLGAKPYMGWSSYSQQVIHSPNPWLTAENIKAQSDAMHEKLQAHGYEYINVDAGWNGGMDSYGRPIPSTTVFPDGIEDVINHVHDNGQKFGLYVIPGLGQEAYDQDLPIYGTECTMRDITAQPLQRANYWGFGYKIDFSNPCAQKYIDTVADQFAEWGVDFLKLDSVTPGSGIYDLSLDTRDNVKAWSQALASHGIWLELSWALDIKYADTWKEYANGWRVHWDIECYCQTLTKWDNISRLFPTAAQWWRHAGPGGWNDFDSLNIGNGAVDGLTPVERQTTMSFFAMSAVPLYSGNDLTDLDDYGLQLLTNDEVIAVDQAGRPARPVSTDTDQQVWYANNGDGTYSVGLFNLGNTEADVNVDWRDIGITGAASVRDLWSHAELGSFENGYHATRVPSHGSRLLKVTVQHGTSFANDDDIGIRYAGSWVRNEGREWTGSSQSLLVNVIDSKMKNSSLSPISAAFDKNISLQSGVTTTTPLNSSIVPTVLSFDKTAAASSDVTTTMTLNNNELVGITNGVTPLVSGDDYTVSGDVVAFSKEYLGTLSPGTVNLSLQFSAGAAQTLTVVVSESLRGRYVNVNDDDASIVYKGAWNPNTNRGLGDYKDDIHWSETNENSFEYTFKGTGIELITELDSSQGKMDIYIDGEFKQTVDTYNASRVTRRAVYNVAGLPDSEHTIKAVKKSGQFMLLDQLRIRIADIIGPDTATFDKSGKGQNGITTELRFDRRNLIGIRNGEVALQQGKDYTVSGNSVTVKKKYLEEQPAGTVFLTFDRRGDYQDDVHSTADNGDYFEYSFKGTGVEIIAPTDPSQGEIDVYVDNTFKGTVSLQSDSRLSRQTVFSISDLTSGTHTIKGVKKTGAAFILDGLRFRVPQ
ncbi:X2-like carbohydrate binding domain-containing protein [Paenibacillus solisilvae]|uniref:Alpha-galactosidase n=1 Tax=Paenibacillus solisilvae TaxID=2486751 RepID=A0ABW0W1X7_9BACL